MFKGSRKNVNDIPQKTPVNHAVTKPKRTLPASQTNAPKKVPAAKRDRSPKENACPFNKCANCETIVPYFRVIIRSIINIMHHIGLQSASEVVRTFSKLPFLLRSVTQTDMTHHWLKTIQQDLGFLEAYAMRESRRRSSPARVRLKQLEQTYKSKMREIQRALKVFQNALTSIGPSILLRIKNQDTVQNLLVKTLRDKVGKLRRSGKHYEELIKNQYVPKLKAMEEKLKIVTGICKKTQETLLRMEEHFDVFSSIITENKRNHKIQLSETKEMNLKVDTIEKENETLKDRITNLTKIDRFNEEKLQTLQKSLGEMKRDNNKLEEDKEKLDEQVKQMRIKLKEALKINHRLTKQLENEKQAKEKLRERFDEPTERMKILALEEMIKQLKEKLQFNSFRASSMKKDLSMRYECDLSDTDDSKTNASENHEAAQTINEPRSSPLSDRSCLTGNPYTDIKAEIVSNYKLIKQLEEEIVSLNELRVKIKLTQKKDSRKI